ncbi:MAG: hypothetical protein AABW82_00150 [Nanoarchaeota archaeon]
MISSKDYNRLLRKVNEPRGKVDYSKSRLIDVGEVRSKIRKNLKAYDSIVYVVLKPEVIVLTSQDIDGGRNGFCKNTNLDQVTEAYSRIYGVMHNGNTILRSHLRRDGAIYDFKDKNEKRTLVRICLGYEEVDGLPREIINSKRSRRL